MSEPELTFLIFTDGRAQCFERMMASLAEQANMLQWVNSGRAVAIAIDDSGDEEYARWLDERYPQLVAVHHAVRLGFSLAVQDGWTRVATPYVFHVEDDFIYNEAVDLAGMMRTLSEVPRLAQIALKRQSVNDDERAAGGIVEMWPDEYEEHCANGKTWSEHSLFFTTNPSVYERHLIEAHGPWPDGPGSEAKFTQRCCAAGLRFAFWGHKYDRPLVTHIGNERIGTGY